MKVSITKVFSLFFSPQKDTENCYSDENHIFLPVIAKIRKLRSKKTSNPKHEITFNNDSSMSSISSISFASSSKSNLSSIQFNYEEEGKLKAPRTKYVQE